jgi:hypothetical protein
MRLAATTAALGIALLLAAPVAAHEAAKGRNGGLRVDAGDRFHAELVANGTTNVVIHLSDADDKPIPADGFKANAIFVVGGKPQRFQLAPGGGSKLVGTAPVAVPAGVKGALQLTAPDGSTAQAKF